MRIDLSPTRSDSPLAVHRTGEVISINGLAYDLAPLPEGATLPVVALACPALVADVTRAGGVLRLTLALPHGLDAPEHIRFPAPLDPAPEGPVDLPGHPGAEAVGAPVDIDWSRMVTASDAANMARAAWRSTREVSKLNLVLAMVQSNLISPTSAIAAAGGDIPTEFEAVVGAMSPEAQTEARIRWAGAASIPRLSPLILAVQAATGMSDETADALFGWSE